MDSIQVQTAGKCPDSKYSTLCGPHGFDTTIKRWVATRILSQVYLNLKSLRFPLRLA